MSSRLQWPFGLRHRSAAAHLLGLRFRILPGAWISVSCECCVLSSRGLRRADHTSRGVLLNVVCLECDSESLTMRRRRLWPARGCRATGKSMYMSRPYVDNAICCLASVLYR
jgi:hypothetical protein